MKPTRQRAREALRSDDFRRLFTIRLITQSGDGLFQAALISSIVFNPEEQNTILGFAIATLVVSLPFSILGPFTGVFIDRWSRRKILVIAPLLRAAPIWLVLFDPKAAPVLFFGGALWVLSVNRFYLATAVAVVPRLVPTEDLLMANSMATVGGTVALLLGVFVGGWMADLVGDVPVIALAGVEWLVASLVATRIRSPLVPHHVPETPVRDELRRVGREFADGITRLARTPRALGPITSITLDQVGQGIVLVLSLFVFRHRFEEGVGSFSNLIGAGGLGVLLGILTVGKLEERYPKERIVARAFLAGGLVLIAVSLVITGWSVLIASFAVGLTFAWKKIPVDTMVQEAIPDGYRGRVFAVYDVAYNLSEGRGRVPRDPAEERVRRGGDGRDRRHRLHPVEPGPAPMDRTDPRALAAVLRGRSRRGGSAGRRVGRGRGDGRGRAALARGDRRRSPDTLPPADAGRDDDRGLEGRTRRRLDARAGARLIRRPVEAVRW